MDQNEHLRDSIELVQQLTQSEKLMLVTFDNLISLAVYFGGFLLLVAIGNIILAERRNGRVIGALQSLDHKVSQLEHRDTVNRMNNINAKNEREEAKEDRKGIWKAIKDELTVKIGQNTRHIEKNSSDIKELQEFKEQIKNQI